MGATALIQQLSGSAQDGIPGSASKGTFQAQGIPFKAKEARSVPARSRLAF